MIRVRLGPGLAPCTGEKVLDVACGTGVVARSASKRMLQGHVTGLDLNRGMLAVARTLINDGAPIEWIEGSALDLAFPDKRFDLVLCQLGLQFFPDPDRALREMRRVLSPSQVCCEPIPLISLVGPAAVTLSSI